MTRTATLERDVTDYEMIRATHAVLGLLSARWSVDVLYALAGGTRRYSELLYEVGEISKKTLTQTLRRLQRDGLVVPPRVRRGARRASSTRSPPSAGASPAR